MTDLKQLREKWIASRGKDITVERQIIRLCDDMNINTDEYMDDMYHEMMDRLVK